MRWVLGVAFIVDGGLVPDPRQGRRRTADGAQGRRLPRHRWSPSSSSRSATRRRSPRWRWPRASIAGPRHPGTTVGMLLVNAPVGRRRHRQAAAAQDGRGRGWGARRVLHASEPRLGFCPADQRQQPRHLRPGLARVSASRSGWNNARPLRAGPPPPPRPRLPGRPRPTAPAAASPAPPSKKRRILEHGRDGPRTIAAQVAASASVARLPRTASQKLRRASSRQALAHRIVGQMCSGARIQMCELVFREARRRAADPGEIDGRDQRSSDVTGSTGSLVPSAPAVPQTASASMPRSRSSSSDSEPVRLLTGRRPSHRPAAGSGRRPARGAPSARNSGICAPVLVTWSSPRITCVMAKAMSSTTEVKRVEIAAVGAHQHRIALARPSMCCGPRTRSSQRTSAAGRA